VPNESMGSLLGVLTGGLRPTGGTCPPPDLPDLRDPPLVFLYFFFNQKFIMQGSLTVRRRHIQTIRKLQLHYALTVMYYQNLNAVSGRQTWASPRVSIDDVALSSRVCSRALTTGPAPNRDAPPDCPHHVPQPEPNTRSGQSPDGVDSP
jgi:hypothetical protein